MAWGQEEKNHVTQKTGPTIFIVVIPKDLADTSPAPAQASLLYVWQQLLDTVLWIMLQLTPENAGNQWRVTKNQFLITVGKYIFFERRDLHLSENIYFPRLLVNRFLVAVHRFPAFSCISQCQLEHNSQHRTLHLHYEGNSTRRQIRVFLRCEIYLPSIYLGLSTVTKWLWITGRTWTCWNNEHVGYCYFES